MRGGGYPCSTLRSTGSCVIGKQASWKPCICQSRPLPHVHRHIKAATLLTEPVLTSEVPADKSFHFPTTDNHSEWAHLQRPLKKSPEISYEEANKRVCFLDFLSIIHFMTSLSLSLSLSFSLCRCNLSGLNWSKQVLYVVSLNHVVVITCLWLFYLFQGGLYSNKLTMQSLHQRG